MTAARSRGLFQAMKQNADGAFVPAGNPTVTLYEPGTTTPITQTIYAAATGGTTLSNPFVGDANGNAEWYLAKPQRVKVVATAVGMGTVAFDHEAASHDPGEMIVTTPGAVPDAPGADLGQIFIHPDTGRTMWRTGAGGLAVPLDHIPAVHADDHYSSMVSSDIREYTALKAAFDEAYLGKVVDDGAPGAIVMLSDREYLPGRSLPMLDPFEHVAVWGAGMGKTVVQPTAALNGGDSAIGGGSVIPPDYPKGSLFNAANVTLGTKKQRIGLCDLTIDGSSMSFDGIEYGWYLGMSMSGFETQDVDYPFAHRVEFLNLPNGLTFGSTVPSRAGAFRHGEIIGCRFENCGLIMHHYRHGLRGTAPQGLASQAGFMLGGIVAGNYYLNNSGPYYTAVGNYGTVIAGNVIEGGGVRVVAYDGSISTLNVDFGFRGCVVQGNISRDAGAYVLNGKVVPTDLNGGDGQPSAVECLFDDDISGTALMDFPEWPVLATVNGLKTINNSGRDMPVVFSGPGTVTSVLVGAVRNDGSGAIANPNTLRATVVPNGMSILPVVTGSVTWAAFPARLELTPAFAVPVTSPYSRVNDSGSPLLLTILPLATDGPGGASLTHLSIPLTAGVTFTIDGTAATPTGIRRNMLFWPVGSTLAMTWTPATVQAALRAYHDADAVFTGWEWKQDTIVAWTGQPAVPDSGANAFNPLACPMAVEVLTGAFSAVDIHNADGGLYSSVQVTSALTTLKHFVVPPGGYYTPTWSPTRPTVKCYAAPNALRAGFYGDSGSDQSTDTLGQAAGNVIRTRFSRMPQGVVRLRDFVRTLIVGGRLAGSEWSPGYTIDQVDSGVTGGGCKDTTVDGALLDDPRGTPATAAHYHDDGSADTTGTRIRAYLGAVSGPDAIAPGGSASRVDATGCWGPGAEVSPQTPPAAPASGNAQANPFPFACDVYLSVSGGSLTGVTLDGAALGAQTRFRIRVGASWTPSYTGTLTAQWVPA